MMPLLRTACWVTFGVLQQFWCWGLKRNSQFTPQHSTWNKDGHGSYRGRTFYTVLKFWILRAHDSSPPIWSDAHPPHLKKFGGQPTHTNISMPIYAFFHYSAFFRQIYLYALGKCKYCEDFFLVLSCVSHKKDKLFFTKPYMPTAMSKLVYCFVISAQLHLI